MEFRQYLNLAKGSSYLKFITGIQYLLVDVLDVLIVNIHLETHFEVGLRVQSLRGLSLGDGVLVPVDLWTHPCDEASHLPPVSPVALLQPQLHRWSEDHGEQLSQPRHLL